jgi:ribosome-binding factor A
MSNAIKHNKTAEQLSHAVAAFIEAESNRQSLITVTSVALSDDFKNVTFFVTVFPTEHEADALTFLKRNRSECKRYIRNHARIARIPFVDFAIDGGEHARQRIEELSYELRQTSEKDADQDSDSK